jgi:hypothetical protein
VFTLQNSQAITRQKLRLVCIYDQFEGMCIYNRVLMATSLFFLSIFPISQSEKFTVSLVLVIDAHHHYDASANRRRILHHSRPTGSRTSRQRLSRWTPSKTLQVTRFTAKF